MSVTQTPEQPRPHPQDEPGLTPEESLSLIDGTAERVRRATDVDPAVFYTAWGVAWLVGFLLLGLSRGPDPALPVPPWVAGTAFTALMVAAVVVTAVHLARRLRGVVSEDGLVGAFYGWSWTAAFVGMGALMAAMSRLGVSSDVFAVVAPALSGLLVGVLYMAGGATWREPWQFGLGAWVVVTTSVGAVLGLPALWWVMALAGGGGFLLTAGAVVLRRRALSRARP